MTDVDLLKEICNLQEKQKEEYDTYKFNYIIPTGTKENKYYIKNTIEVFKNNHNNFNEINNIDIFESIIEKDKLVFIHNTIILKELYAILFFIYQTQINLTTIKDELYLKQYFAKINTDRRAVSRFAIKNKKKFKNVKIPLSILDRNEYKAFSRLLKYYNKDKILFEYIISTMALIDLKRFNIFKNINEEKYIKILKVLSYFVMEQTTEQSIIKSFAILLKSKLKRYMNMKIVDAEYETDIIIEYIFDKKFNSSNIDTKVYLKSILNGIPIYGAKRKSHYNNNQLNIIRKNIVKDKLFTNRVIKLALESQHLEYIQRYPIELLKKIEKK
jgi:hypothetical protein